MQDVSLHLFNPKTLFLYTDCIQHVAETVLAKPMKYKSPSVALNQLACCLKLESAARRFQICP